MELRSPTVQESGANCSWLISEVLGVYLVFLANEKIAMGEGVRVECSLLGFRSAGLGFRVSGTILGPTCDSLILQISATSLRPKLPDPKTLHPRPYTTPQLWNPNLKFRTRFLCTTLGSRHSRRGSRRTCPPKWLFGGNEGVDP